MATSTESTPPHRRVWLWKHLLRRWMDTPAARDSDIAHLLQDNSEHLDRHPVAWFIGQLCTMGFIELRDGSGHRYYLLRSMTAFLAWLREHGEHRVAEVVERAHALLLLESTDEGQ